MIASPADLTYFIEIAHTLNVSRAAERLGISQPSLSFAMQRLERAVGAALLIRSKRGVTLTQAGKQLLVHAKSLLQAWEEVKAGAVASMHEVQGAYTIGCHASIALASLSGFLPRLLEEHPKLNIQLQHDLSRKIMEGVISSKIDVGIVVNPVQHPDLVIHKLCTDEFTLWQSERNKNPAVLICDADLAQSQVLSKKLKKSGMTFDRIIISGSLEVIADLAANGGGVGLLPGRVAALARKKLTRLPKAPVFYDEHCLIYRVESKNVKSIQVLNTAIKEFFTS